MGRYPEKREKVTVVPLGKDYTLREVTLGYLSDVANGVMEDTPLNAVLAMSDIPENDMERIAEMENAPEVVAELYDRIFRLSFGRSSQEEAPEHDEDGGSVDGMIAALVTRGHTDAYNYGVNFAATVVDVLSGKEPETQKDNAEKMREVFGGS